MNYVWLGTVLSLTLYGVISTVGLATVKQREKRWQALAARACYQAQLVNTKIPDTLVCLATQLRQTQVVPDGQDSYRIRSRDWQILQTLHQEALALIDQPAAKFGGLGDPYTAALIGARSVH